MEKVRLICIAFFLTLIGGFVLSCGQNHERVMIIWPNTNLYQQRIDTFNITPNEARKIIIERFSDHNPIVFQTPSYLVGDYYVYGLKDKDGGRSVYGYYVDGKSGDAFFVESKTWLKRNAKKFPVNEVEKQGLSLGTAREGQTNNLNIPDTDPE